MAIAIGILALAALIIIHEAGHFFAARLFGMRVNRFSIGFSKSLIEWKPRNSETTYSIGALPLGGYVQVDGLSPVDEVDPEDRHSYANQPLYAKLTMIIAGPAANFLSAVLFFAILFTVGMPVPVDEPIIGRIEDGRAAQEAGFQSEDRLLKIDGQPVATWEEMRVQLQKNRGNTIVVEYQRNGEMATLDLTPEPKRGMIGISPATRLAEPIGPVEAMGEAFALTAGKTAEIAIVIGRIISGRQNTEGVTGPVGIVGEIARAMETGWRTFLALMAQLSISLCLFNFLPIPALDGGRVTFLAIEAISRRRVNRKVEGYVHAVGLILVLGLVLVVTFRDVLNRL